MFGEAPQDVIDILREENVTANFHGFCVTNEVRKVFCVAVNGNKKFLMSCLSEHSDSIFAP